MEAAYDSAAPNLCPFELRLPGLSNEGLEVPAREVRRGEVQRLTFIFRKNGRRISDHGIGVPCSMAKGSSMTCIASFVLYSLPSAG